MKTTQILYLLLLIVAIIWVVNSTYLLDFKMNEGFASSPVLQGPVPVMPAEPIIPQVLDQVILKTNYLPDPRIAGELPYGPYAQQASVGSFPYQDPALQPADLHQMKMLFEDIRGFLVFQGVELMNTSDPTVSLPLTQLRSDSRRLQQEVSILDRNPGIPSSLTQQDVADIQQQLTYLQKKVRLFQTSGVITEGFTDAAEVKTRATATDLQNLQSSIYAAILTLSSSGTVDAVTQARILNLQNMYSSITDMINKLDKGIWTATDVPVFKEDIDGILPNLATPAKAIADLFSSSGSGSGSGSSGSTGSTSEFAATPTGQALAELVGPSNLDTVLKNFQKNGNFNVDVSFGYNGPGSSSTSSTGSSSSNTGTNYNASFAVDSKGDVKQVSSSGTSSDSYSPQMTGSPFDTSTPSYLDTSKSGLDWKKRNKDICEQIRLRGLDPADFGCLPAGSVMSPAFSWRGYTKMICGRLGATLDSGLPQACGCPPDNWSGWTL